MMTGRTMARKDQTGRQRVHDRQPDLARACWASQGQPSMPRVEADAVSGEASVVLCHRMGEVAVRPIPRVVVWRVTTPDIGIRQISENLVPHLRP